MNRGGGGRVAYHVHPGWKRNPFARGKRGKPSKKKDLWKVALKHISFGDREKPKNLPEKKGKSWPSAAGKVLLLQVSPERENSRESVFPPNRKGNFEVWGEKNTATAPRFKAARSEEIAAPLLKREKRKTISTHGGPKRKPGRIGQKGKGHPSLRGGVGGRDHVNGGRGGFETKKGGV